MAKKRKDRHPHFAGVRHAGHDVAAAAHADNPMRPPSPEFSADQEQAMRAAGPGPDTTGGGGMQPLPPEPDGDDSQGV